MIVLVAVVVIVAATRAMLMFVVVAVGMLVAMLMVGVIMMSVTVMRMPFMGMAMMIVVALMGALFRAEAARDRYGGAALAAGEFREGRIILDVESIAGKFRKAMLAAEMPREPHEAERVFGADLEQRLGGGRHLNQLAVLEPKGIAVVDGGLHVEIEVDLRTGLTDQMRVSPASGRVIERNGVDDPFGLHGGLADDGGDVGHDDLTRAVIVEAWKMGTRRLDF